jgi:imidazolonepropionase-like amidohydrolase
MRPQTLDRCIAAFAATLAAASLTAATAARGSAQAADQVTAFVDVTVVPMDRERTLGRHTVVVRGERIVAMGPTAATPVPAGAIRIDGRGKFLMPGLAEMHAHVVGPGTADHEAINRDILFLYVANGITSIRAMLGAPNQLTLRERLQRNEVLGPTMYVSAPSLNNRSAPNPDTAEKLVRAHKAAGYDFLKIHPGLSRETYDAIARTAREVGLTWAGHVPLDVGLRHAMSQRQATVDHLDGVLEATLPDVMTERLRAGQVPLPELVANVDASKFPAVAAELRAAGTWNVPTILVWENLYSQAETPEDMGRREELTYWPRQAVAGYVNQKRNSVNAQRSQGVTAEIAARYLGLRRQALKALADAGTPLLMGTDSPQLFMVPGFALHREMRILAEAGLSPFRIYESGSKNVARYVAEQLKQDGSFGTVAVGHRADLVLLDADPLASVANVATRAGVMVRGRWVPAAEIERGLAELAERAAR